MARKTVLVVDDDPDVRLYLGAVLEHHGFRVLFAEDGACGFALARTESPDLICLDVDMPRTTGVKMFRLLRSDPSLRTIPVVMITGLPEQFERFIKSRRRFPAPEGYIPKPFMPLQVVALIRAILSKETAPN